MAKERSNVLNKAKSRTKAFSENAKNNNNVARIMQDIQSNGPALYGVDNFYIHNNNRNFLFAAEQVNAILNNAMVDIRAAWLQEAETLKQLSIQKQDQFLNQLSSIGITSKKVLEQTLQNQIATYQIDLSSVISKISNLPKGKKTADELKLIANQVIGINEKMKAINANEINNRLIENLKAANEQAQKFISWCDKHKVAGEATSFNGQALEHTQGLSTTKLMFYTLPSTLETLVVKAFKDVVPEHLKKEIIYTASNTAKGTSADLTAFNMGISIKMNANTVKQAKTRIADTFFQWNEQLNNTEYMSLGGVQQYLFNKNKQNFSLVNALKYLFVNYGSLQTLEATSILDNAWKVVILSNLNEKLFGYGKLGQKGMTLKQIIDQMPVAEINSSGQVIWFSDIIANVITKINQDTFNIHSLASYKLNAASFDNKPLLQAKKNAISKMKVISYKNIMKMVSNELSVARSALVKNVQLSVQYHVNLGNSLQQ